MKNAALIISLCLLFTGNAVAESKTIVSNDYYEVYVSAVGKNETKAMTQYAKDAKKSAKCFGYNGQQYIPRLKTANIKISPMMLCAPCRPGMLCAQGCITTYRAEGLARLRCEPAK